MDATPLNTVDDCRAHGFKITVEHYTGLPRQRNVYYLIDAPTSNIYFSVHNNNLSNLLCGVCNRVALRSDGTPPPEPSVDVDVSLGGFRKLVDEWRVKTPRLRWWRKTERSRIPYFYTGRKRRAYQAAVDSLFLQGLTSQDYIIKSFVKAEKLNMTDKENPIPRIISPASTRYNVELGCYLKELEHELYRIVKKIFGEYTVFKNLNALQAGRLIARKWSKFVDPVCIMLDCSRFDQHVRKALLEFEHSIYKLFYQGDGYLDELLTAQLVSKCVATVKDGCVKYEMDGGRCSGHPNTALGNCLIMCALVWTYMFSLGFDNRVENVNTMTRYELGDNGDDAFIIVERCNVDRVIAGLPAFFLAHGFVLKVETPVDVLEKISFCQTSPVWTPDGYIMVRDPLNGLSKDNMSFDNMGTKVHWQQACRLIGECGLHLAGHIPMYTALYKRLVDAGGNVHMGKIEPQVCGMWWLSRNIDYSQSWVVPQTRYSFWLAFGILPDHQIDYERRVAESSIEYRPTRGGHKEAIPMREICVY